MRISVIASLIVAVHLGVVMMVMTPGCATVKREPPAPPSTQTDSPVIAPADQNRPEPPPLPPMIQDAPVESSLVFPTTPTPVDVPQVQSSDNIYVVQRGDSLSKIAVRHGVKTADLATLNHITDPNKIFVGQKLLLPAYSSPSQSKPAAPAAGEAPATVKNAAGQTEYVVQRGDALSKIARKFGVTQAAIMEANGIKDPNKIAAGKKLVIPAAGAAAAPAAAPSAAPADAAAPAVQDELPVVAEPEAVEIAPADMAAPADGPDPATLGCIKYRAGIGDTIDSIVTTFAVDRATFLRLNHLSPDSKIEANQELFIPPMGQ